MTETNERDFIGFRCDVCGTRLGVDKTNPPSDEEIFHCNGCGRPIGKFGDVKRAMIAAAKEHLNDVVSSAFGKPIKLDWNDQS